MMANAHADVMHFAIGNLISVWTASATADTIPRYRTKIFNGTQWEGLPVLRWVNGVWIEDNKAKVYYSDANEWVVLNNV